MINLVVLLVVIVIISSTLYWMLKKERMSKYSPHQLCLQHGTEVLAEETEALDGYTFTLAKHSRVSPELSGVRNSY